MPASAICPICEKKFSFHPSQKRKFCSRECFEKHRAYIEVRCLQCHRPFLAMPHKRKIGEAKFCSHTCQGLFQHEHHVPNKKPKLELILNKISKPATDPDEWIWQGTFDSVGTPRLNGAKVRTFLFRSYRGSIPYGMKVIMSCAIRECVSPAHMTLVKNPGTTGKHYTHGNKSLLDRFWEKIDKQSSPHGCWLWTGSTSGGYGRLYVGNHTTIATHVLSYIIHNGPVLNSLFVCHNCPSGDNKRCCNPLHLWLGTSQENSQDASKKGVLSPSKIGEKNPAAKLIEEDVMYIRQVGTSISSRKLAAQFGVTKTTINAIRNGAIWTHLIPEVARALVSPLT